MPVLATFWAAIFQDLLSEDLPQGHSRWSTERDGGCEEAASSGLVFCDDDAEALEVSDFVPGLRLSLLVLTDLAEGDWDDDREFLWFLPLKGFVLRSIERKRWAIEILSERSFAAEFNIYRT